LIDDYFQTVLVVLQASPYVKSHNVTFDRRSLTAGTIRGDVYFLDDSLPHFREFVNTEAGLDRFTYVFHYQQADGSFVFRYDNTGHYPDLDNFPHHQHVGDEDHALSSAAPDLARVIQEIEDRLISTAPLVS